VFKLIVFEMYLSLEWDTNNDIMENINKIDGNAK
jgi:hypothetical protein